ncbi:MAG TPA: outer membrane protein transport protein [Polyangiaceae bacterium]
MRTLRDAASACRLLPALALFAATSLAAAPSRANGFLIYDLSGEALGRASAVSADATEPAANWFNPASLAYLEGIQASIGGTFVTARTSFEQAGTGDQTSSERGNFVLPALFASAKVSDELALGVGVYSAFGIGLTWPYDWLGRENAISASLVALSFNPNVALKLSDQWSVAVGFDALRSTVDFQNGLPPLVGGDVRLVGGTWGFGFNAGVLYRAIPEELQFALTYRSRVKLGFEGQADFSPENPDFGRALPDQPGHADITLPDIITFGVLGKPARSLKLTFEVNTVLWSTYDTIDIDFESAPDRALHPQGQNSFTLRAGADYLLLDSGVHVRGGIIFDRSALPAEGISPALPESDRIDFALGLGYEKQHFKIDLGYLLVNFLPAEAKGGTESPEGTYHTTAHLLGLTAGARF